MIEADPQFQGPHSGYQEVMSARASALRHKGIVAGACRHMTLPVGSVASAVSGLRSEKCRELLVGGVPEAGPRPVVPSRHGTHDYLQDEQV